METEEHKILAEHFT